ncbi:MAG TPA: VWA domain-containing protein [Candidatus Binatia bacterium]|nr:VWA domain-containing protein [Candidatus Binatia bacterium]
MGASTRTLGGAVNFQPGASTVNGLVGAGSSADGWEVRGHSHVFYRLKQSGNFNTESYASITDNSFLSAAENPLSTFSIDVDTASYANVRRFLTENRLPPPDAVRIEEMVNYFDYNYPPPRGGDPFSVNVEVASCPWKPEHRLVRIGLKGREVVRDRRPPSNLVFLIDVSGSMDEPDKLPLLKESLKLLTRQLSESDHVSIVVYAGAAGVVLPETDGSNKATILRALSRLRAGGSTHGSAGIRLAYKLAERNFIEGGVNRVILCTDGDFNVGVTSQGDLTRLIQDKAKSGVFLSVLGFGTGNYKDSTMEMLADKGNGNYAYIDSLNEGRKVLVEQMSSTLVTIAKDVKIQIEFNPAQVNSYRLIGYDDRLLAKEDFNDDKKDAGEIGAGHTVTALYEVVPAGMTPDDTPGVDPLKYQRPVRLSSASDNDELLTLKLRYKQPDGNTSRLLTRTVKDSDKSFKRASTDFKFAAAVAEFGMLLRHSPYSGDATLNSAWEHAKAGLGKDPEGYRAEFLGLIETAQQLSGK